MHLLCRLLVKICLIHGMTPKPPNSCGRSAPHAPHRPSVCSTSAASPAHPLPREAVRIRAYPKYPNNWRALLLVAHAGAWIQNPVQKRGARQDNRSWFTRRRINKLQWVRTLIFCDVLRKCLTLHLPIFIGTRPLQDNWCSIRFNTRGYFIILSIVLTTKIPSFM